MRRTMADSSVSRRDRGARVPWRRCGEPLLAGSVLQQGPARLRVTRVGVDTRLSAMVRLIGRAAAEKPRSVRGGERARRGLSWSS